MDAASGERTATGMDAAELMLRRASALALRGPAASPAALELMFASAVRAPDHGRLRPWRLFVIDGDARLRFGDLLADAMRRRNPQASEDALARERQKAMRAPTIIVVAVKCDRSSKIPVIEQVLSAGAAAQNIMLAAYAQGLGAMWKTGDPAYDPDVKAAFGLQPDDTIVGFIYVGADAGRSSSLPRPDWRDHVRSWGKE